MIVVSEEAFNIICPCCNKKWNSKNKISQFIDQIKQGNNIFVSNEVEENAYFSIAQDYKGKEDYLSIKWACNQCLNSRAAIKSKTFLSHQKNTKSSAFAFFDFHKYCKKCNKRFLFRKEEWAQWIDIWNFYFQVDKKFCDKCQSAENIFKKISTLTIKLRELPNMRLWSIASRTKKSKLDVHRC